MQPLPGQQAQDDDTGFGLCTQAGRRWCLSGTPIQNSVDDLYSCFRFLRYDPYCKRAAFKTMLKDPLQDDPLKGAQLLQVCLKVSHVILCCLLRLWLLQPRRADLTLASSLVDSKVCLLLGLFFLHSVISSCFCLQSDVVERAKCFVTRIALCWQLAPS